MSTYSSVGGLWPFVRLHVSQFNRPLVIKLLKDQTRVQRFTKRPWRTHSWRWKMRKTNLFFGHVQQTHRVSLTLKVVPDGVQRFVELTFDIRQLFEHFAGGPQKNLCQREQNQNEKTFYWRTYSWDVKKSVTLGYLTPSRLHVIHVCGEMLESDDCGERDVLGEELKNSTAEMSVKIFTRVTVTSHQLLTLTSSSTLLNSVPPTLLIAMTTPSGSLPFISGAASMLLVV